MKANIDILQSVWGYDGFRPGQEDIINAVLNGNDVLALLPTGGGKSICYQLPAIQMEGICLVISPLIALMRDQVDNLRSKGIKASAIYAGMKKREIDITLDNCIYGNVKFLYVSPERLTTNIFKERLTKMNVCLVAVDEAHCISQWGYDFRPPYLEIAAIRSLLPDTNFIAVTASATPDVQSDITEKLQMVEVKIFKKSFSRENLSYAVLKTENKEAKLVEVLKSVKGSKIVYVSSRKAAKDIAGFLISSGIDARHYHAGLTKEERTNVQANWISNQFKIIVATNAFGMGIDKPDVRIVVHFDMPSSMEAYYQEAGRAGRDGLKAYAVLLYYDQDLEKIQTRFEQASPDLKTLQRCYQSLANYLKLAVGSGLLATFDFDVANFGKVYDFDPLLAYYAIKKLENEGFVQLNEGFYNASKVMIIHNKQDLYKFQIAHENFDHLIKALLRMYGGELFSDYCSINEAKIGDFLNKTPGEIKKMLLSLNELKIISYFPQAESPQLTLLTPRLNPEKLPIDVKAFESKRKYDQHRIDAIKGYINNRNQCRTQQIVGYFGEDFDEFCGICDWCVKRNTNFNQLNDLADLILSLLDQQALSPSAISAKITDVEENQLANTIQSLLDNHKICYLENGLLAILKKTK